MTKGYKLFSFIFVFCFSILFLVLLFSFEFKGIGIFNPPSSVKGVGNIFNLILYCINAILDIAVLSVFIFFNYYVFKACFRSVDYDKSGKAETRRSYVGIICFFIVTVKIILLVLYGVISGFLSELKEDPFSWTAWFAIIFFAAIAGIMLWMFWKVLRLFGKAVKADKMDVFKGIVINKVASYTEMKRSGEIYSYSIELHSGKKFINVQRAHYELVQIGQNIEIEAIPFVGEILKIEIK